MINTVIDAIATYVMSLFPILVKVEVEKSMDTEESVLMARECIEEWVQPSEMENSHLEQKGGRNWFRNLRLH